MTTAMYLQAPDTALTKVLSKDLESGAYIALFASGIFGRPHDDKNVVGSPSVWNKLASSQPDTSTHSHGINTGVQTRVTQNRDK